MPRFVDGFVLPVPRKNMAAYRRMARIASRIWRDHGALEYRECVADGPPEPCGVPFAEGIRCRRGETVVFAWIVYRSRAHRDRVNAKVMKDPRIAGMAPGAKMPFDIKRMLYGGFRVFVEA